ncbi:MAG: hypoxanthine phosphoribosyltransferase, partial [Endomicrobiia bacterium]
MKLLKPKKLISEKLIQQKVTYLAKKISSDYKKSDVKKILVVGILKGSVIFLSDLVRKLTIPTEIDFIALSSYSGIKTTGVVRHLLDLRESPVGKDILIVEDIVDTGYTLKYLKENILTRKPNSVKICVLLDKLECRKVDIEIDYKGFVIPNKFVVG